MHAYSVDPADLDSDVDGDGQTSREESRFGTNPYDANSVSRAIPVLSGDSLILDISTIPGARYQVSTSRDLVQWFEASEPLEGSGDLLSISYPFDPNELERFWRIESLPPLNSDADPLNDLEEGLLGTSPVSEDTDDDDLNDDAEFFIHQTNPLREDSDFDGRTDGEEINLTKTDPLTSDAVSLTAFTPASGEGMVSVTREIIIRFSGRISPDTIDEDSFFILGNGQKLPGRIDASSTGEFVTFYPDSPLPPSTKIRIHLDGSRVRDLAGYPVDITFDGSVDGDDDHVQTSEFQTLPLTRIPNTEVWGIVRDSESGTPLVGATIRVDAFPEANAVTDSEGKFLLEDMPAPEFFVHIDGSTATNAPEGFTYPSVGKPFHSVPGATVQLNKNGAPFDVFLPKVKLSEISPLSDTEATEVTFGADAKSRLESAFPEVDPTLWDELQVTIEPGAAIDDDGNSATMATIVPVEPDRIPAPLPPNLDTQLVISIQTPGATSFDVPATIRFPNLRGLPPNSKAMLMSFDHDSGVWHANGTGTVSEDGRCIVSDPGVGILAPGWHIFDWLTCQGCKIICCEFWEEHLERLEDFGPRFQAIIDKATALRRVLEAEVAELEADLAQIQKDWNTIVEMENNGTDLQEIHAALCQVQSAVNGLLSSIDVFVASATAGIELLAKSVAELLRVSREICRDDVAQGDCYIIFRDVICIGLEIAVTASAVIESISAEVVRPLLKGVSKTARRLAASITAMKKGLEEHLPDDGDAPRKNDRPDLTEEIAEVGSALGTLQSELSQVKTDLRRLESAAQAAEPAGLQAAENIEAYDIGRNAHYAFLYDGFAIRGTTSDIGAFSETLPPDTSFELIIFDREKDRLHFSDGRSGPSGSTGRDTLPRYVPDSSLPDSDSDGLSDKAEMALGTSPTNPDTDGDGITDQTEIDKGLDPLSGLAFPTGVIASLPLFGEALEACVEAPADSPDSLTAYIATGSHGLAIIDVSEFDNPIVLGQLDLEGNCTDVAVDPVSRTAAIAANEGGLHLVDTADSLTPGSYRTLPIHATQVELSNGLIYATRGTAILVIDYLSGFVLQELPVPDAGTVTGMTLRGSTLYTMDSKRAVRSYDIAQFQITEVDSLTLPHGSGKISVSQNVLYAAAADYNRGGYATVDVSDPSDLRLISGSDVSSPIIAPGTAVLANGSGLSLLVGSWAGNHVLDVLNASEPSTTNDLLTRFDLPSAPEGVVIASGIALVPCGDSGLHVVNYRNFDSGGVPPAVSFTLASKDVDPEQDGLQLYGGRSITAILEVSDDSQVRDLELLVNGQSVVTDVTPPFNLATILPNSPGRSVPIQVRATDTGGNAATSDILMVELVEDDATPSFVASAPPQGRVALDLNSTTLFFDKPVSLDPTDIVVNGPGVDGSLGTEDDVPVPVSQILPLGDRRIRIEFFGVLDPGQYQFSIPRFGANFTIGTIKRLPGFNQWLGSSGNWNDPWNWSLGRTPISADRVSIKDPTPGLITVNLNTNSTIESISCSEALSLNRSLTVTNGESDIEGDLVWAGGILTATGDTTKINANVSNANRARIYARSGATAIIDGTAESYDSSGGMGISEKRTLISSDGEGSIIFMRGIKTWTSNFGGLGSLRQTVAATNGGIIDLNGLESISGGGNGANGGGPLEFRQTGGGQIRLAGLKHVTGRSAGFVYTSDPGSLLRFRSLESYKNSRIQLSSTAMLAPELKSVSNSTVILDGEAASLQADKLEDINFARIFVRNGASFATPLAITSYNSSGGMGVSERRTIFSSDGEGSELDLSSLTSMSSVFSGLGGIRQIVTATNGGAIRLPNLAKVTGGGSGANGGGPLEFSQTGSGVIEFGSLMEIDGRSAGVRLTAPTNWFDLATLVSVNRTAITPVPGTTLQFPLIEQLTSSSVDIRAGTTIQAPLLTSIYNSTVVVDGVGATLDAPALENIDLARIFARNGAVFRIPDRITSYNSSGGMGVSERRTLFSATGEGSLIDLSSLKTFTAVFSGLGSIRQSVLASNGGVIDLSNVETITGGGSGANGGGPLELKQESDGQIILDDPQVNNRGAGVRMTGF